ncbi:MAG: hypothetical protein LBS87_03050 [Puniceicoccales bacterium]|nr:hypothetical protein [Puniceicoccales bacterium]
MSLFLLSCALCGCESTEEAYNSKLPWARPAAWDAGRQIDQTGKTSSKAPPSRSPGRNP